MERFRRLPAYVDFRDPADSERYERKVAEALAIHTGPEMVINDEAAEEALPYLLLEQAS